MNSLVVIAFVSGYLLACLLGILRSALRKDRISQDLSAIVDGYEANSTAL